MRIDPEGPVSVTLTRIANIALINCYFIICCIPIFTIGASFTALMDVAWNMTKGTEGTGITRAFFHSFKTNFKRSTAIWLIQLVLLIVVFFDYRIMPAYLHLSGGRQAIYFGAIFMCFMLVSFTTWYALTMQAIFDNTVFNMIKNALIISIARFPYSLLIAVLMLSPLVLLILPASRAYYIFPLVLILWFGMAAYGAAYIFRRALKPFLPEGYGEEKMEEEDDMEEALSRLDEIWDIYDKDKKPTGRTMRRNDWNMADGDYHLTVLGIIQRPDGRYLITKRVATKEWAPGAYEVSGGGVRAGESSQDAVRREVLEETGLDVNKAQSGGYQFDYRRDNPEEKNNYFVDVYKYVIDFTEDDIHLQADETDGYELATSAEIKALAEKGDFLHYDSIKQALQ